MHEPAPSSDEALDALGLDRLTRSRIARAGLSSLGELRAQPPEQLWRCLGRHGLADLVGCLAEKGLPPLELGDYERWRLGLIARQDARADPGPHTPIAALWPTFGTALVTALRARHIDTVLDLAPRTEADVCQIYRLGRTHLQEVERVLAAALAAAPDDDRQVLQDGLKLLAECDGSLTRHRTGGRVTSPDNAPAIHANQAAHP